MNAPIPSWEYNPELRQCTFDYAVDSPGSWFFCALDLKVAADRLNWQTKPIKDEESSIGLHSVYRLLIGLSFENLLKGILVAQGDQILRDGKLHRDFTCHKLSEFAGRIDPSTFTFSKDDMKILKNLEHYVIWAGKYPFPKRPSELVVKGHSSIEIATELDLWDRLCEHLKSIGWITKGNGTKLYLNKSDQDHISQDRHT